MADLSDVTTGEVGSMVREQSNAVAGIFQLSYKESSSHS